MGMDQLFETPSRIFGPWDPCPGPGVTQTIETTPPWPAAFVGQGQLSLDWGCLAVEGRSQDLPCLLLLFGLSCF